MIEVRAVLPAEIGAEVVTALELALDRDDQAATHAAETDEPDALTEAADATTTATLEQRKADALVALARTYLDTEPSDRTGEDRHLVIVELNADTLTAAPAEDVPAHGVPAGTPTPATPRTDDPDTGSDTTAEPVSAPARVPAGTSQRCGILGAGPLETRTAERLACNGKIALKVTDAGGEILYLGRSQRLASRAQRRALRLRDTTCVFPGCHQTTHLDAHHTTPWSHGGPTDIDGLALLCRRHHVMVHEGGLHLAPHPERTSTYQPRFQVLDTTGHPVQARWPAMLEHLTLHKTPTGKTADQAESQQAAGHHGPDPTRIAPTTGGAGFNLANCVDTLLHNILQLTA